MTPLLLLDTAEQAFGFAAVVIAVIGGTTSFVVALRRQGKMLAAMYDAVMGQEEVRDRSGAAIRESQPGLAAMQRLMGSQVEGVDRKVDALVHRVQVLHPHGPECPEGCGDSSQPAGCPFCGFDDLPWCPDHEDPLG